MFKRVTVVRNDSTGRESQRILVPIEYSPRESWLDRLRADDDISSRVSEVLPRLAYEMTAMRYDGARKLNSLNQRIRPSLSGDRNAPQRFFAGTPYILTFSLYSLTRSIEDTNQIIEQVVPHFTPDYALLVNLLPSVGVIDRMRILMDGAPQIIDTYEQDGFLKGRQITTTFTFNVAATLFGPIAALPATLIRKVLVDLYDAPYDALLTGPIRLLTESFGRLQLNDDSGYLLDESTVSDLRTLARISRIQIEPDPLDAAPVKPVDTTTTITNFADGKAYNPWTGVDVDIDVST